MFAVGIFAGHTSRRHVRETLVSRPRFSWRLPPDPRSSAGGTPAVSVIGDVEDELDEMVMMAEGVPAGVRSCCR